MSAREIRRAARTNLHERLRVAAVFIPLPEDSPPAMFPVTVRIHSKFDALGDRPGVSANYGERAEVVPRIVFWLSELPDDAPNPVRGSIVSVEEGEAYEVDHVEPPDGQTVTAAVTRLTPAVAANWPTPEQLAAESEGV